LKHLVLLYCLTVGCVCSAQTSWQGLRFGMASQEARELLLAKQLKMQPAPALRTFTVLPDFELKTDSAHLSANLRDEIATATMYFGPQLSFDGQDKLQTITLTLDQTKVFQTTPAFNNNLPILTMVAGTSLYEQLTAKYGRPAAARGPCADVPSAGLVGSITECDAKWNAGGQSIELFWNYNWPTRNLLLFVRYSSANSGL
jgi:hypothetical protein